MSGQISRWQACCSGGEGGECRFIAKGGIWMFGMGWVAEQWLTGKLE